MKVREWVGLQKEMVQEISGILSIALLTANLGITVFLLVRERGGLAANPLVVVPLVMVGITALVWGVAHAWHFRGKMHFAKQRALATLNPFMTTEFTPHEWVLWWHVTLPQLRSQRDIMVKLGMDTKELDEAIARAERWLREGSIPKDEFPGMLERFLRAS